ncbi:MAG: hypothetical protein II299_01635, partial [Alistipes sp.]|nr:hypothetical protein [Alistipes sp.]
MGTLQYKLTFNSPGTSIPLILPEGQIMADEFIFWEPSEGNTMVCMMADENTEYPLMGSLQVYNMVEFKQAAIIWCICAPVME